MNRAEIGLEDLNNPNVDRTNPQHDDNVQKVQSETSRIEKTGTYK